MRTAVLSDVRGNLIALRAAVRDAQQLGVEAFASIGGMIADGPYPEDCLSEICRFKIALSDDIDLHLADFCYRQFSGPDFVKFMHLWSHGRLNDFQRKRILEMPPYRAIGNVLFASRRALPFAGEVAVKHPDWNDIREQCLELLESREISIVVCSSVLNQGFDCPQRGRVILYESNDPVRFSFSQIDDRYSIVYPGRVGGVMDFGVARYCIIDGGLVEFRAVHYDVTEIRNRYLEIDGLPSFIRHRIS